MSKSKSRKKRPPNRVLELPDLEHAKTAVLNSLTSASGQRTYDHAIREFVTWYCLSPASRSTARRTPVPDSPRTAWVCARHDQPSARRGSAGGVRGCRCRSPESGTRSRHPPRQRGTTDWRATRELADAGTGPAATRSCNTDDSP
jgi:hypothetical protein